MSNSTKVIVQQFPCSNADNVSFPLFITDSDDSPRYAVFKRHSVDYFNKSTKLDSKNPYNSMAYGFCFNSNGRPTKNFVSFIQIGHYVYGLSLDENHYWICGFNLKEDFHTQLSSTRLNIEVGPNGYEYDTIDTDGESIYLYSSRSLETVYVYNVDDRGYVSNSKTLQYKNTTHYFKWFVLTTDCMVGFIDAGSHCEIEIFRDSGVVNRISSFDFDGVTTTFKFVDCCRIDAWTLALTEHNKITIVNINDRTVTRSYTNLTIDPRDNLSKIQSVGNGYFIFKTHTKFNANANGKIHYCKVIPREEPDDETTIQLFSDEERVVPDIPITNELTEDGEPIDFQTLMFAFIMFVLIMFVAKLFKDKKKRVAHVFEYCEKMCKEEKFNNILREIMKHCDDMDAIVEEEKN